MKSALGLTWLGALHIVATDIASQRQARTVLDRAWREVLTNFSDGCVEGCCLPGLCEIGCM